MDKKYVIVDMVWSVACVIGVVSLNLGGCVFKSWVEKKGLNGVYRGCVFKS